MEQLTSEYDDLRKQIKLMKSQDGAKKGGSSKGGTSNSSKKDSGSSSKKKRRQEEAAAAAAVAAAADGDEYEDIEEDGVEDESTGGSKSVMRIINDGALHVVSMGVQHSAFLLFGIAAAGIYVFGDAASV